MQNGKLGGGRTRAGMPLGNLTSQFFANVYLNELDQFVKHSLKARFYIRYVDDFVLLGDNLETLIKWRQGIERFLFEKLLLRLHPKRRKLQPISNGIDFLGYIIRSDYILVRRRVINNLNSRLRHFERRHCETRLLHPSLRGCEAPEAISKSGIASSLTSFAPRNDEKSGIASLPLAALGVARNDGRSKLSSLRVYDPLGSETFAPRNDEARHSLNDVRSCLQSYLGHFKWADTYRLMKGLEKKRMISDYFQIRNYRLK